MSAKQTLIAALVAACGATPQVATETPTVLEVETPSPDEDFRAGLEAAEADDVLVALERFSRACDGEHSEACAHELQLRIASPRVGWDPERVGALANESTLEELEARRLAEACSDECPAVWAGLVNATSADVQRTARFRFADACARDASVCSLGCDAAFVEGLGRMCEDGSLPSPASCLAAGRAHNGVCRTTPSCARRYLTRACAGASTYCADYRALSAEPATETTCDPASLTTRVAAAQDIEEIVDVFEATTDDAMTESQVRAALSNRAPGLPVFTADGRFAFEPHEGMGPRLSLTLAGRRVERPRPSALTIAAAREHVRGIRDALRGAQPVFYYDGDAAPDSEDWTEDPFRVVAGNTSAELYVGDARVWRGRGLPRASCVISTALAYHVPSGRFAIRIWSDGMMMGDYDCPHVDPEFRMGQLDEETRQLVASRLETSDVSR